MEMLHQQVQRKKEKMARLADLQRQIDEASEEVRHLAQDEQNRRPQHRELHQEGFFNEDDWYEDFHHGNFAFDDASPLSAELQATPWPPSYKPPQLPMYDGHSDPKRFLMSYEATISSYGGNTTVMAKLLGRRQRRHPSLNGFANLAAPMETRRLAELPFVPRVTGRRPVTRSSHLTALSNMEAQV
jgi:hypothetical protein